MGKKTRYHPVSLHIIRGSLESVGFTVGRLRQLWADPQTDRAAYNAELTRVPRKFLSQSPTEQLITLNSCFSNDVDVISIVTYSYRRMEIGKTTITLETKLIPDIDDDCNHIAADPLPTDDLSWLADDEGFGQIEADAHIAEQQAVDREYDITF